MCDKDTNINHLRSLLSENGVKTMKCSACGWVDEHDCVDSYSYGYKTTCPDCFNSEFEESNEGSETDEGSERNEGSETDEGSEESETDEGSEGSESSEGNEGSKDYVNYLKGVILPEIAYFIFKNSRLSERGYNSKFKAQRAGLEVVFKETEGFHTADGYVTTDESWFEKICGAKSLEKCSDDKLDLLWKERILGDTFSLKNEIDTN